MNLRPPGPQPGALPDCATPRRSPDDTPLARLGRDRQDVDDERTRRPASVDLGSGGASTLRAEALRESHRPGVAGLDIEYDRTHTGRRRHRVQHLAHSRVRQSAPPSLGYKPVAQLAGGLVGLPHCLAADGLRRERRWTQGHPTERPIVMRKTDRSRWASSLIDLAADPAVEVVTHRRPRTEMSVLDHHRDVVGVGEAPTAKSNLSHRTS